jgi:hypothetical protein
MIESTKSQDLLVFRDGDGLDEARESLWDEMREFQSRPDIGQGYGEGSDAELREISAVWVISGPEVSPVDYTTDLLESGRTDNVGYNQSEERFKSGVTLIRKSIANRIGKSELDLTLDDMRDFSRKTNAKPVIYWNAKDGSNKRMRDLLNSDVFEDRFQIPKELIHVTDATDIRHTGDQISEFPESLINIPGKIAVISDAYHLPRISRYLGMHPDKFPVGKMILQASGLLMPKKDTILNEIQSALNYIAQGHMKPRLRPEDTWEERVKVIQSYNTLH